MSLAIAAALALLVAALGTAAVLRLRPLAAARAAGGQEVRWRMDEVPRLGGLGIAFGLAVGLAAIAASGRVESREAIGYVAGAALVTAVGVVDDVHGMRPVHKLVGQVLAALVAIAAGTGVEIVAFEPAAVVLGVLWIVAVTNAVNLLDNMDGLAGGVALIAAATLSVHAFLAGVPEAGAIALVLAAAVGGFLPFNLRPRGRAAIFMGDGGSHLLGFSLAWLALFVSWSEASGVVAAIAVPALVLAIPIADTAFVSVSRLLDGRPISQGGRDHTSHRLVLTGLSERRAVLLLLGGSALFAASSVAWVQFDEPWLALVGLGLSGAVLVTFALTIARARSGRGPVGEASGPSVSLDPVRPYLDRALQFLLDVVLISCAFYLAWVVRLDGVPGGADAELIARALPVVISTTVLALAGLGLYRLAWRYAGVRDAVMLAAAVALASVVSAAVAMLALPGDYPPGVFAIDAMIALILLGASRLAERAFSEWLDALRDRGDQARVLIVGTGDGANMLLRRLRQRGEHDVLGLVGESPRQVGLRAQGVRVVGSVDRLADVMGRLSPDLVALVPEDLSEGAGAGLRGLMQDGRLGGVPCVVVDPGDLPRVPRGEPAEADPGLTRLAGAG